MAFAKVSEPFEFTRLVSSEQNAFSKFLGSIQEELILFESKLLDLIHVKAETSKKITQHFFKQKGKRIRPALFLSLCKSLGYTGEHLFSMACVSEYVHTASLLHDDVVDNSLTRRGFQTAHTLWGRPSTILVGDLIYAQASELMAQTGELEIVSSYAKAISQMSEGEIIQLENVYNPELPEETYTKIIRYKTASLLAATCKTAGILSKLSQEKIIALEQFAQNLGISFQLVDDALDYASSQNLLGKKRLKDLEEGKVTLPLILLLKRSTLKEKEKIHSLFKKKLLTQIDIAYIDERIKYYKTSEETLSKARSITEESIKKLDEAFPDQNTFNDLKELARNLSHRKY